MERADTGVHSNRELRVPHLFLCKDTPGFRHGEELPPRCMGAGKTSGGLVNQLVLCSSTILAFLSVNFSPCGRAFLGERPRKLLTDFGPLLV